MDYRGRVSRQPSVEESAHCTEDNEDSDIETVADREQSQQEEYVNFQNNNRVDDYPRELQSCRERNGHSQPPESLRYPERKELPRREIPKQLPESQPKRGVLDPFKLMRHSIVFRSDYVKDNLSQFSQTQGMTFSPEQRQASGHSGCDPCDSRKTRKDKEPHNYRQQTCCDPKSKYRDDVHSNHSCNSCYDTPPPPKKSPKKKASCESCCAARFQPRPQPSCESCCAPPPSKPRRESRDKSYSEQLPPRPRREPKQCDFYCETPARPRREPQSRPRPPQPNSPAGCACGRPAPPQPRPSPSQCSCSKKPKQRGYAASKLSSDYTEYKEFKPPICRNPLVVRSRVGIPSTSKQRPSTSCPANKELPQRTQVFCECGPSKQSKLKPQPTQPRPTREYCTNSAPADYAENQPSSGLFTRNSLTVTSCNVKINACPRQAKPPSNSDETLNERKVRCQRYCNPPRPKCPSQEPPRKCKRCNKSRGRPKTAPSTRNSCVQFQESPVQVDGTCYVPPTCFAPTTCPAKRKRNTEARRGRSCSGFTVKPTNSIQKTRRTLNNKLQCAALNSPAMYGIRPMVRGHRAILRVRLSGCGVNCVGSRMLMGSGYKMIPFPALTKLNMNRRIPKLNPSTYIYPRCRGGKLTPTTTRVLKSRQTNSQRLNSANSLATARTCPRRVSESRRDRSQQQGQGQVPTASYGGTRTPQSTVRRDLPQRYQPASTASHRPVQVTEEVSHPVPRRSHHAGPAPQITRQQSVAQATTKPVSNRAQQVERAPAPASSRGNAVKKSVSIRLKEPSTHPEEKGHALNNNRTQEGERAPAQSQSRSGPSRVHEAERPSQNQSVSSRVQEGAARSSQNQSQNQSVPGRVQDSGRFSSQSQSPGHSRSGSNRDQETAHTEAGLALPNREQKGARPPVQAQSRAPAFLNKVPEEGRPSVRSQSRGPTVSTRAAEQIPEKPQYSGSARNQPETLLENDKQNFYRGSFLTIRSPMPSERPTQSSARPHGSLIMIAQNGLQPQILKRSIPKGSSFIVPNKWQCMGIRKLISHYLNSNDRHKMINSHSSQSTGTSGFHGTEPRPSVIAQVPATQKATELKPSVTNHFVLGKKQQNVNYCANLNRNFPVNAPMESKKPELLRYLGGSCKLCAVCGQEKIWHGQNTNGICASCNAKIQGALGNFKRQQQQQGSGGQRIKGALDRQCTMGCSCQDPCSCENRRQQEEQRRITKEKHRQQRKPERERVKSGQQSQPFSIIVLQDCNNNNLIDQLTAALTVGCQQDNAATEQPQSNGYNKNGPGKAGTTIGNAVPPEYGMGNEVQKPDNFACTCDCQACRTGFENTLKLPMLMAQALEIFVMKNSLSDKMAAQKSKSDIKKSSSTSVQGKGQKRQAQLGAEESSTSVRIKKSKGKKRDKTQSKSKDMPRSQTNDKVKQKPDKFRGDKDKGKGGRSQPKSKDLPKSQSDVSYKQKSNDKIKSDKFKESFKQKSRGDEGGKGKRRKDKKNLREEINQTKFFLPPKKPDQTACLENSRYPCSEQRNTGCVPGCQDANGNCTRFSGGCSQSNLLSGCSCSSPAVNKASKQMDRNVGAGDQPSHGHCSRSFNCQGCNPGYCLGCSSCGYFSFRPPRENMHPIAHFRPGVNLYPANCVFLRNGDFVRRSLVRTAAGVTLHEVQRERELESKQPMTNPYPNPIPRYPSTFPCGSNFQFWR